MNVKEQYDGEDLGASEGLLVAVAHVEPVGHRWKCVFHFGWWQLRWVCSPFCDL